MREGGGEIVAMSVDEGKKFRGCLSGYGRENSRARPENEFVRNGSERMCSEWTR